jgi:hypothetical protein
MNEKCHTEEGNREKNSGKKGGKVCDEVPKQPEEKAKKVYSSIAKLRRGSWGRTLGECVVGFGLKDENAKVTSVEVQKWEFEGMPYAIEGK